MDMQPEGLEEDEPDQKIENQKIKESPHQRLVCCKAKGVTLRVVVDARDNTQIYFIGVKRGLKNLTVL